MSFHTESVNTGSVHLTPTTDDVEALRRRIAHDLHQRLAFTSFVVWTGLCFLLFITFAAGNPRPVPSAIIAMTAPVIPAVLIWFAYRPLVRWKVARTLHATGATPAT
jgi:hypothetical protein